MPVNAIRAPDLDANLNEALRLEPSVPAIVHAVARWALPEIRDNYVRQEAQIRERILEAEALAGKEQAELQRRDRRLKTWAVGGGVVLSVALAATDALLRRGYASPGFSVRAGEISLLLLACSGAALIGAVALFLRIHNQSASRRRAIARKLEAEKARLQNIEGDLEPDAVLRVGRVYWAFELVPHASGRRIPVNLAAATRAESVRLVCPAESPAGEAEQPDEQEGLAALERMQAGLARWQVDEDGLRLPILPGTGAQGRELEQELNAMVRSAAAAGAGRGPVVGVGGAIAPLDGDAPLYTASWQRCLAQGERWLDELLDTLAQARRAASDSLDAFRAQSGHPDPPAPAQTPLSDWMTLQEKRPEASALLAELRVQHAELEERLRTGIVPEARAGLLDELRQVLQEIYHKPWTRVVEPIEQLERAHASAAAELRTIGLQLAALSAQDSTIRERESTIAQAERRIQELEAHVRRLGGEFGSIHSDAQSLLDGVRQLQADLGDRIPPRLGDTALDPRPIERKMAAFQDAAERARRRLEEAVRAHEVDEDRVAGLYGALGVASEQAHELVRLQSEYARHWEQAYLEVKSGAAAIEAQVKQWQSFQRDVERRSQEGQDALKPLQSFEAGLHELRDSVATMRHLLERYQQDARESFGRIRAWMERSNPIVQRVAAHLDDRERALAKLKQDLERLQNEYYAGIEREKARVRHEIEQLEARQARVAWMAGDPARLIDELAGCSVEWVARRREAPPGARIQATIAAQVERAIEATQARIESECERRMEAIRAALRLADGALQIVPGSDDEAGLLLVPLWYVEWRETLDPEVPEKKRFRYRLALPFGIVQANGRRAPGELYPALERCLQGQPDLGAWAGDFEQGGEPPGRLAAQARRHACLQEHEIEALAAGMRAAVARHAYPRGYDEMVDKSRDDLREWRDPPGVGTRPARKGGA